LGPLFYRYSRPHSNHFLHRQNALFVVDCPVFSGRKNKNALNFLLFHIFFFLFQGFFSMFKVSKNAHLWSFAQNAWQSLWSFCCHIKLKKRNKEHKLCAKGTQTYTKSLCSCWRTQTQKLTLRQKKKKSKLRLGHCLPCLCHVLGKALMLQQIVAVLLVSKVSWKRARK
jgi:hypothetical protein